MSEVLDFSDIAKWISFLKAKAFSSFSLGSVSFVDDEDSSIEAMDKKAVIIVRSTSAQRFVFLPKASDCFEREIVVVKADPSSNAVSVVSEDNINSVLSYSITNRYGFLKIKSDGTQWFILGKDVMSIESRLDTAEGNISSLDSRLTTAENDINTAEGNISSLDGRVTSLEVLDDYVYVGDDNNHLSYTHGVWLPSSIYIDIPVGTWEVTFSCRVNAFASSGNFSYCFLGCCLVSDNNPVIGGAGFGQYSPIGISGGMQEFECYGSRTFLATYTSTTRLYLWYVATMYGGSGHRSGMNRGHPLHKRPETCFTLQYKIQA